MNAQTTKELWETLLSWLDSQGCPDPSRYVTLVDTSAGGGRGLVANSDIPPNTQLIKIRPSALLNTLTLREFYPPHFTATLTATQWVSLHLSLQHSKAERHPSAPSAARDKWGPFLRTLPRSFPTVPLTWSIGRRLNAELLRSFDIDEDDVSLAERQVDRRTQQWQKELLDLMPPSVRTRADEVEERFRKDWLKVKEDWSKHRLASAEEQDELYFLDYLLAWQNVNTRCVYYETGGKTSDCFTLAPVIDMINHRDGRATKPTQGSINGLTFSSPEARSIDPPLKKGDELSFSYGAHENAMLITEYGFALPRNPYSHVDVTRVVRQLFEDLGEMGELKRGILQDQDYWSKMTLQPASDGGAASADWILLLALRMLHLKLPPTSSADTSRALTPWLSVMAGDSEVISPSNEAAVRATLRTICDVVVLDAKEGIPRCEELEKRWEKDVDEDHRASLAMLRQVWTEEKDIAEAVAATCASK